MTKRLSTLLLVAAFGWASLLALAGTGCSNKEEKRTPEIPKGGLDPKVTSSPKPLPPPP